MVASSPFSLSLSLSLSLCVHLSLCTSLCLSLSLYVYIYIYIYIYRERERERERDTSVYVYLSPPSLSLLFQAGLLMDEVLTGCGILLPILFPLYQFYRRYKSVLTYYTSRNSILIQQYSLRSIEKSEPNAYVPLYCITRARSQLINLYQQLFSPRINLNARTNGNILNYV